MKDKINEIIEKLHKAYPNPKTELANWTTPVQLMVCVILSAQATDKGVNKATPALFSKYKTAEDFAKADSEELKKYVQSINFFNNKVKSIINACKYLVENHKGHMPKTIEELVKIPGLGRKSANVILNEAFDMSEGIVVDTHMTRVTKRLELQPYKDQKDAVKIEQELMKVVPKDKWRFFSASVVLHGRYICKAKKPDCENCVLNKICPAAFNPAKW